VLANLYISARRYHYCPQWALSWEWRKRRVLEELRHYDSDIVTLQVRE